MKMGWISHAWNMATDEQYQRENNHAAPGMSFREYREAVEEERVDYPSRWQPSVNDVRNGNQSN